MPLQNRANKTIKDDDFRAIKLAYDIDSSFESSRCSQKYFNINKICVCELYCSVINNAL